MKVNPNKAIEFLLARGNLPILYWLKKDILEVRWEKTYYIVDTLKNMFRLYNYGCILGDEGIQKAVKFLFSTQSKAGDFRGAYLNEYAPTYHALTLEVLCLYGLDKNERTQKGFLWIMKNRQDDGGWVIPYRTIDQEQLKSRYNFEAQLKLEPVKPDKSQPFSHLVTGMVLRALAASPTWRKSKEAWKAGELLLSRFFKADKYNDRWLPSFWEELTYPFWATDEKIKKGLNWVLKKQNKQGYWEAGNRKFSVEDHLWVTFAVLRVFKRFGLLEL